MARPVMSNCTFGATPQRIEAATNPAVPIRKMRLRPSRSAVRPPMMSSEPKPLLSAVTTHDSVAALAFEKSLPMS